MSVVHLKSDTRASDLDDAALAAALENDPDSARRCRALLDEATQRLADRFEANHPIEELVQQRARTIDHIISSAWGRWSDGVASRADVVAVGGYGRGELHPGSDVDILILVESRGMADAESAASKLLTLLWDIGLDVGHSVRTLDDCRDEAAKDVSVLTSLMESRLLAGRGELFSQLSEQIGPNRVWSSAEFYRAKLDEQIARHRRYHDTAYNLEPNVKSSPGGLRDIQVIRWIAQRHFAFTSLEELVGANLLTGGQLRILTASRAFLWRIRFALHHLTGRREDRLLFDHQIKLAKLLGYEDASYTLAVEQLMQRYYRTVMEVSRLNEMLLQIFEESIFPNVDSATKAIGKHFRIRSGYLEVADDDVFARDPSALLEIFLHLENNITTKGINARTIALIKQHLWLIDEEFRQNPRHHRLFLEILRAPRGLSRTLRRMNTYGVLGLYIPAFGRVVGRMQYDLFHAYTVDAHTLFVVENLRRMSIPEFNDECPHGSEVMQKLEKPEIVYLAGLFHDIAKGRGGDHSELGAVDAESFCLEHGMSRYDAHLVAWLVKHHLALSLTAQKKDVNDPNVIIDFAKLVGDRIHLDYLYALTVADVRGTNPQLWNSWKDSLFWDLYQSTLRALRRGFSNPIDEEELVLDRRALAQSLLGDEGMDASKWKSVWETFSHEYYLRHKPTEIAWHTRVLSEKGASTPILVATNSEISPGMTLVMVYAPKDVYSFARTTAALDDLGLNVVDARILPLLNDHSLDTYSVLETDGTAVDDPRRLSDIEKRLITALNTNSAAEVKVSRRAPRQVRMFSTPVEIDFSRDPVNDRTVMEIIAGDRPGLLLRIGAVLEQHEIELHNAKIATIGERAEDVFFVTRNNRALDDAQSEQLGAALHAALTESSSASTDLRKTP